MGDPRKLRQKLRTPGHPFQRGRIEEEIEYVGKYGLRNKHEFWKHRTQVGDDRKRARYLRTLSPERGEPLFNELRNRLYNLGLVASDATTDDILRLTVNDYLNRRLQTVVLRKGMARTIYQARQLIVHGHISIAGQKITSPSHLVLRSEEPLIEFTPTSPFRANKDLIWQGQAAVSFEDIEASRQGQIEHALKKRFTQRRGRRDEI